MMRMTQFVYEVDATDVNGAITAAADKIGVLEAAAIEASNKTIMRMEKLPDPGRTDSVKRNLSRAYRLASSVNYGRPTAADASGVWDVTEVGDADRDMPFCVIIDCGIPNWDVVTYRKVPKTKATARYHLRYVVEVDGEQAADFDKVSEAKAFAKQVMTDPGRIGMGEYPGNVAIRRMPVSDGASNLATMYQKKVRVSKTRPTKTPEGACVIANHHWLVYGRIPEGGSKAVELLRKLPSNQDNAVAIGL